MSNKWSLSLWLLPLLLVSCRDPKMGFRADVVSGYSRIDSPTDEQKINNTENPEIDDEGLTKVEGKKLENSGFQYFRLSNTIEFQNIVGNWSQQNKQDVLTLSGHLIFAKKIDFGNIELQGVLQNGKILLLPTNEQLRDKNTIKAQAICYSEDDNCTDFFVDVFVKVNKKVFHDQFVQSNIAMKSSKFSVPTGVRPDSGKELETTIPGTSKPPAAMTPPAATNGQSKPPSQALPAQPATAPESEIEDEMDTDIGNPADFVGVSTDQVDEMFSEQPAKPKDGVKIWDQAVGYSASYYQDKNGSFQKSSFYKAHKNDKRYAPWKIAGGRLEKGTNLLQYTQANKDASFQMFFGGAKQTHYGTHDMLDMLLYMGDYVQKLIPNFKLSLGDVSDVNGGQLGQHRSHLNGLDADISYLVSSDKLVLQDITAKGGVKQGVYLKEQWKLLKQIFSTNKVEVVFVVEPVKKALCEEARRQGDFNASDSKTIGYKTLSRLMNEPGHQNHFHMRLRCSEAQPRCRQVNITPLPKPCS